MSYQNQSDSDHFSKIEFTIGGWDSYSTLILEGGKILVFPYPGFNIGNDSPEVNHSPSNEEWLEFSQSLDQLNVKNWKRSYNYQGIEDGTQWRLKIQTKSSKIDTGGSNAYPENFNGLLKAINMLINNDYFNEVWNEDSEWYKNLYLKMQREDKN